MPEWWAAALAAALWVGFIVAVVVRFRDSRNLNEYPATAGADLPTLSVIVPARNEARNIARCLRSICESSYPRLEIIVVDDHSSDGTGDIARAIAAEDAARHGGRARLRVIEAPELPSGWFGKQWACHTGARAASGSLLCFTDADTAHGPELLLRSVNAMRARGAALFTVAGHQEMDSFWEKVIQPFVFVFLLSRYGGTEISSRSTKPLEKIANGQFLLFTRAAYDAAGGHTAVRSHVAEDLRLAQVLTAQGQAVHVVLGQDHLRTRMYASLAEIRRGWGKNIYAGGRDTLPLNAVTRALLPFVFPIPALMPLVPTLVLGLALAGLLGPQALLFGATVAPVNLLFWIGAYGYARLNPLWGLLHPLAALMFAWICAEAAWRGSRVEWKGRGYQSISAQ